MLLCILVSKDFHWTLFWWKKTTGCNSYFRQ